MNVENSVKQLFAGCDSTHTPGCAIAVMKEGEVIYKRGFGMANLEYGVPIRPDTIFHIASISKTFTAMAVTMLADEGKCALDDPIQKYIPEMQDFGETVTLQHLIHHTSGIRDQWDLVVAAGWRMEDVITMQDILELLYEQKELNFKPGDEFLYSNSGYTLLAEIVHRITGKDLQGFCKERIFDPLGMNQTHFHEDNTLIVSNRAYSYDPAETGFKNSPLNYANVGATSLFTTVEDMAKWDQDFYDNKVIPASVIKKMYNVGVLNDGEESGYAHGILVDEYRGVKRIGHAGGDAGFATHWMQFPGQKFSVVIFANASSLSPSSLCEQVADIYLEKELEPLPEVSTTEFKSTPESLKAFAGTYFNEKTSSFYKLLYQNEMLVLSLGPGVPLTQLAENEFCLAPVPSVKIVIEEKDRKITFTMIMIGKPETFVKIDDYVLADADKDQYPGTYYCPELDVEHKVILKDGKLAVSRKKYYFSEMESIMPDGFDVKMESGWRYFLKFERDNSNDVCGFLMSSGRVRNLKFVRLEK